MVKPQERHKEKLKELTDYLLSKSLDITESSLQEFGVALTPEQCSYFKKVFEQYRQRECRIDASIMPTLGVGTLVYLGGKLLFKALAGTIDFSMNSPFSRESFLSSSEYVLAGAALSLAQFVLRTAINEEGLARQVKRTLAGLLESQGSS